MSDNNKIACCIGEEPEKGLKEGNGCCADKVGKLNSDEPEESSSCVCGCVGEFPDESLILNPEHPGKNADKSFFQEFEETAHSMGIVDIGYTRIDPEIIEEKGITYPNAMVFTFKMDNELIKTAPGDKAQDLNEEMYAKLGKITYELSDFIRSHGFATQVAHPHENLIGLPELAQKAGLGWKGKHGMLITPELGPKLKISAIFTGIENLPEKQGPDHSWIAEYCQRCTKCTIACSENAMVNKIHPHGEKETEFHPELCIGCSKGCTSCIEECVFYKRGYDEIKRIADKLKERMLKKKQNTNIYHLKRKKRR